MQFSGHLCLVPDHCAFNYPAVYNILGLNFGHDGAAAIVRDGRLVCAIANERLARKKKAIGVTREMIDYVLGAAGLTLDDIDYVAFASFRYRPDSFVKVLDPQGVEVASDDRMRQLRSRLTVKQQTLESSVEIEGKRFKSVFVITTWRTPPRRTTRAPSIARRASRWTPATSLPKTARCSRTAKDISCITTRARG